MASGKKDSVAINDVVWRQLKRHIKKAGVSAVRVGVLAERGGNEIHDQESGATMVEIAAIHEFGAPGAGIPERSFIRRTFKKKQRPLARLQGKVAGLILQRRLSVRQALEVVGLWGAEQVKATITGTNIPPPLKPETIARKGSSKPLVDTGRLVNSVNYAVDE